MKPLFPALFSCLMIAPLHAGMVYVDATGSEQSEGNTFNADTRSGKDWLVTSSSFKGADQKWSKRTTGMATSAFLETAYEAATTEKCPVIFTKITGLTPNQTYTGLRLYFIDNIKTGGLDDWFIAASLKSATEGFQTYTSKDATAVDNKTGLGKPIQVTIPENATGAETARYWVALPDTISDSEGNLRIWITIGTGASNRCGYDGIAYDNVAVSKP